MVRRILRWASETAYRTVACRRIGTLHARGRKVCGPPSQRGKPGDRQRSGSQETTLQGGDNRTLVSALLALQDPPHTPSHRSVVHQSHQIQAENGPGEQTSPMDPRMGRIQTIPHMASWRQRLGHQPPTLLGNPTPSLDMPRLRRTYCRGLQSRAREDGRWTSTKV